MKFWVLKKEHWFIIHSLRKLLKEEVLYICLFLLLIKEKKSQPLTPLEKEVLLKLIRRRVWGSKHIRLSTLLNCGWKSHEKGKVKTTIKILMKEGYIIWAKMGKTALQLNKIRSKNIMQMMGEK